MNSYHTRGSVPIASKAYVSREFERQVLDNLYAERWVLLLGPRQHGKTTSLLRIQRELNDSGYQCAYVDLQSKPLLESYEEYLAWFARELSSSLGREFSREPVGYRAREPMAWFESAITAGIEPIVILVDEAAAIETPEWLHNFYSQLRAVFNRRAQNRVGDLAKRLLFVFAGTFLPEYLIPDTNNSPFNVCESVFTDDLTLQGIKTLQEQVEARVDDQVANLIFDVVGGQPYLTQVLLQQSLNATEKTWQDILNRLLGGPYTGIDDHLSSIFRKIAVSPDLVHIITRMIHSDITVEPASPSFRYLQVIGVAKIENALVSFRNRLYHEVANRTYGNVRLTAASKDSLNLLPIKILFLSSSPRDQPELLVAQEAKAVSSAIRSTALRDRLIFQTEWAVTAIELQEYILQHDPQIVHFSGHGVGAEGILLENTEGKSYLVSTEDLSELFRILRQNIRCVVLNSCNSEIQAQAIANYIDFVIGIPGEITDEAAKVFSISFYQALGYGKDIAEAFELGGIAVKLVGLGDFGIPILKTRTGDCKNRGQ